MLTGKPGSTPDSDTTTFSSAKQTLDAFAPPSLVIFGRSPTYTNQDCDDRESLTAKMMMNTEGTTIDTESEPIGLGLSGAKGRG